MQLTDFGVEFVVSLFDGVELFCQQRSVLLGATLEQLVADRQRRLQSLLLRLQIILQARILRYLRLRKTIGTV